MTATPTPCPICAPTDTRGDPVVLVECDACGGVAWLAVGEVEALPDAEHV